MSASISTTRTIEKLDSHRRLVLKQAPGEIVELLHEGEKVRLYTHRGRLVIEAPDSVTIWRTKVNHERRRG